eukprot:2851545-Pyramimonas_sp.AAC.2
MASSAGEHLSPLGPPWPSSRSVSAGPNGAPAAGYVAGSVYVSCAYRVTQDSKNSVMSYSITLTRLGSLGWHGLDGWAAESPPVSFSLLSSWTEASFLALGGGGSNFRG